MRFSVSISALAESDLHQIYTYITIDLHNKPAAKKVIAKILAKIDTLEIFPRRDDIFLYAKPQFGEIRTASVGNYVIFYAISDRKKTVIVHRIIYARRNLSKIFRPK